MGITKNLTSKILKIDKRLVNRAEKLIKNIPLIKAFTEGPFEEILVNIKNHLHQHDDIAKPINKLPDTGLSKSKITQVISQMAEVEESMYKDDKFSNLNFPINKTTQSFLNKIFAQNSAINLHNASYWPRVVKFENEIIAMLSRMITQSKASGSKSIHFGGSLTSSINESLILVMKAYRDHGHETKGIIKPEIICSNTVHPAVTMACQLLGIKRIVLDNNASYTLSPTLVKRNISKNTLCVVVSAPNIPHGTVDPIKAISEITKKAKVGLHIEASLGGFILPFLDKSDISEKQMQASFDFKLANVNTISLSFDKFGCALPALGAILYQNKELMRFQYFADSKWAGGIYLAPTLNPELSGGLVASLWASMLFKGKNNYQANAKKIFHSAKAIKEGVDLMKELDLLGNPLWILAISSERLDINQLYQQLIAKNYQLDLLQNPTAIRIVINENIATDDFAKQFIKDLKLSIEFLKNNPSPKKEMVMLHASSVVIPKSKFSQSKLDKLQEVFLKGGINTFRAYLNGS